MSLFADIANDVLLEANYLNNIDWGPRISTVMDSAIGKKVQWAIQHNAMINFSYESHGATDVTGGPAVTRKVAPVAMGLIRGTRNLVFRGYQMSGDSFSNKPVGWKIFRIDRVSNFKTSAKETFLPSQLGNGEFNATGDRTMSQMPASWNNSRLNPKPQPGEVQMIGNDNNETWGQKQHNQDILNNFRNKDRSNLIAPEQPKENPIIKNIENKLSNPPDDNNQENQINGEDFNVDDVGETG